MIETEIVVDMARPKRRQDDSGLQKSRVATLADLPERCEWNGCGGAWHAIPGGVSCLLCGRDIYVESVIQYELRRSLDPANDRPLPERHTHENPRFQRQEDDGLGKGGGPHPEAEAQEPPTQRYCLRCERSFTARGKFNRICSACRYLAD